MLFITSVKNDRFSRKAYSQPMRAVLPNVLALLLLSVGGGGCISSRTAANRIVEAPNHYASPKSYREMTNLWASMQTMLDKHGVTNSYIHDLTNSALYWTVRVGPPPAEITAVELPPKDYHLQVFSKVENSKSKKRTFTAGVYFATNSTNNLDQLGRPATVFLLHGYMLSKESMALWAVLLAESGYRVVSVDLRGHGQSTGDTVSFGKYETEDLKQLLDYMIAHKQCDSSVGVLGVSYGATLALHWAAHDPRIRTVVAVAPYNHPEDAILRLAREFKIPITLGAAEKAVALSAARLDLKWADWSGAAAIRQVRVPVLLIGGGKDSISRPDDLAALQNAAAGESKLILIPIADHFVISMWFQELADPVRKWFQTRLVPASISAQDN
jgi:pimeloyl-ACP methyl ester carboxylesterase